MHWLLDCYFFPDFSRSFVFLLLARYVPNVAKRSVWEQCNIEPWGPTTDRPTSHFGKFQTAISRQRVIRFTLCLVLGRVFEVGGSNGAISGCTKSKMAADRHLRKFQMAISPERVVRSTSCLILCTFFGDGGSNGHTSGCSKSKIRPPAILENFEWPYLWNELFDPLSLITEQLGENNARGIRLVTI